jgi:hypothetical protein
MPDEADQPLTAAALLAELQRRVVVDVERVVVDQVTGTDRHLTAQVERLWDALLGTREKLEIEYLLIKSGIARLEDRLERIERRLSGP